MVDKLNLKVDIDTRSGFCFGVIKAIKKAEELLDEFPKLYCLGQIVHNEEEVKRLEKKGLITINHSELDSIKEKNILFRAHGEPPETYSKLNQNINKIYDATCPVVIKLQERIKKADKNNETILIFGKKNHPEVVGLVGQSNRQIIVFESIEELNLEALPKKITLFGQTTKDLDKYYKIKKYFIDSGFEVKFNDTICRQVSNRKKDLIEFSKKHDKIVFISGKNSSNGKLLFDICQKTNPNSYFITSLRGLKAVWFNSNDTVGICGATSTPMWLMEKVQKKLNSL